MCDALGLQVGQLPCPALGTNLNLTRNWCADYRGQDMSETWCSSRHPKGWRISRHRLLLQCHIKLSQVPDLLGLWVPQLRAKMTLASNNRCGSHRGQVRFEMWRISSY